MVKARMKQEEQARVSIHARLNWAWDTARSIVNLDDERMKNIREAYIIARQNGLQAEFEPRIKGAEHSMREYITKHYCQGGEHGRKE